MPHTYIQDIISAHPVVLFMKGTENLPLCGFSQVVLQVLRSLKVDFSAVDVLDHPTLRQDLKIFSRWPTFPQLYIAGQFIGGCDIVQELHAKGQLASLFWKSES